MVVVKLIGGLGNQMFQYAAGTALAKHLQTTLALDRSFLDQPGEGYTQREFELGVFKINATVGGKELQLPFDFEKNKWALRFRVLFPYLFKVVVYNESRLTSTANFFKLPKTCYLNGYWQDLSYFSASRSQFLQDFQIKIPPQQNYLQVFQKINELNSVGVHVRRGDYLSLEGAAKFHGLLPVDYYKSACRQFDEKLDSLVYFVFSDDIQWCRDQFGFLKNVHFVDGKENGLSAAEELLLMSTCKHNIIANSSYSWWAAWLNQNPEKHVIAPENWFNTGFKQPKNLIPKDWIRI